MKAAPVAIFAILINCLSLGLCSKHNDSDTEECAWSADCKCHKKNVVTCSNLSNFPKFTKQKGKTLEDLAISDSKSLTIDGSAFNDDALTSITSLSLNKIGTLHSISREGGKGSLLAPLQTLVRLDLSGNKLDSGKLSGLLDVKDTLTVFICRECGLKSIPQELGSLTRLKTIDLRKNDINTVPNGLFQNLTKLQTLELSDNPLTSGKLAGFSDIKKITSFRNFKCNNCKLTEIPTDISTHPYLKNLELQHNNITVIRKKDFDGTSTKLPNNEGLELSLRSNQLEKIEKDALVSLKYEFLTLGDNLLKEFDMSWIPNKVLNSTGRNGLGLKGMKHLDRVYVSDPSKVPRSCSVIDLSESSIQKLDEHVFDYCLSNETDTSDFILMRDVDHFDCSQDLKWMVPCTVCKSERAKSHCHYKFIKIDGSTCANKTSLADHLKTAYASTAKDCEKLF